MKRVTIGVFSGLVAGAVGAAPAPCPPGTAELVGDVVFSGLVAPAVDLRLTILETPELEAIELVRLPSEHAYERSRPQLVAIESGIRSGLRPIEEASRLLREPAAARAPISADSSSWASVVVYDRTFPGSPLIAERPVELTDTAPAGDWVYHLIVSRTGEPDCAVESDPLRVPTEPPCGPFDVCQQVASSLRGSDDGDTARLEWGASSEDESVSGYRISRVVIECIGPACGTDLGTVRATASCGTTVLHSITDDPMPGAYIYRLEVLDEDAQPECSLDTRIEVGL